jgi:Zn finger protein HypA/HybF involved in hydrogenase expression
MHDFHLANEILKITLEAAKKNRLKEISLVKIELGDLTEHGERILPQNLKFNFQLISKDTIAQKAKLIIVPKTGNNWRLVELEGK